MQSSFSAEPRKLIARRSFPPPLPRRIDKPVVARHFLVLPPFIGDDLGADSIRIRTILGSPRFLLGAPYPTHRPSHRPSHRNDQQAPPRDETQRVNVQVVADCERHKRRDHRRCRDGSCDVSSCRRPDSYAQKPAGKANDAAVRENIGGSQGVADATILRG